MTGQRKCLPVGNNWAVGCKELGRDKVGQQQKEKTKEWRTDLNSKHDWLTSIITNG